MSAPAVLIATAKVRPEDADAFTAWQGHHDAVVSKFPGFLSSDLMPPGSAGSEEWTFILNFETAAQLEVWQRSPERAAVLAEALPFFEGGNIGEVMAPGAGPTSPGTTVTEVILSKVKPGMEATYREWATRIQAAQAKYPGYRGMYLQPPSGKDSHWTTLVRYDTAEHLEAWMAAPERAELLAESKAFIESEELMRLATSFPGWVPVDPVTGKGPPNWKTSLLVLLGLFPIVMLEMKYLSPVLHALGLHASLATFIGNVISVFATSFATMPLFVRWFGWWLFPEPESAATSWRGSAILAGLFGAEIIALWWLLPW